MVNIIFIIFYSLFIKIENSYFNEYTKNMIKKIINNTYNESNICEKSIYSKFQEDEPLNFLVNSSSLENNDITSYFSCDEGEDTNYYIITFKPTNPTEERINGTYDINYSLYGICLYNNSLNCTDSEIINYLRKIANKTEILNGKKMKIFNMKNGSKIKIENIHIFMTIFFGVLTLSIFIFSILPIIPQVLLKCCFLKKKIFKIKRYGYNSKKC